MFYSIVLTGFEFGRKIHAIKHVRALTGFGLKEAKYIVDDLEVGRPRLIQFESENDPRVALHDGTLTFSDIVESQPVQAVDRREALLNFMDEIDSDLTIRQVYQVLRAVSPDWRSGHYGF